jgi:hypothetical protein
VSVQVESCESGRRKWLLMILFDFRQQSGPAVICGLHTKRNVVQNESNNTSDELQHQIFYLSREPDFSFLNATYFYSGGVKIYLELLRR